MEAGATKSVPRTTRTRAAHLGPERRRPQILDAALELFLEHGYEGTSMQALADRAGVTKPVIYSAFESKDALFRALLEREEEWILGEISSGFEGVDLANPEQTLVDGFTAFLRAVAASPGVYRLIFLQEGGGNAALGERIRAGREAQVQALATLTRSWLVARDGDDGAEDLDQLAGLLGQALVGLAEAGARLLLASPDSWTPETLAAKLGRLAMRGQQAL
jgi:AcrR family transcriptional regulator